MDTYEAENEPDSNCTWTPEASMKLGPSRELNFSMAVLIISRFYPGKDSALLRDD